MINYLVYLAIGIPFFTMILWCAVTVLEHPDVANDRKQRQLERAMRHGHPLCREVVTKADRKMRRKWCGCMKEDRL
jgi:heme exporter protein D